MLTLFSIYSFRLTDSCKAQRLVLTHWTHFCSQVSQPFGSFIGCTSSLGADGALGLRLLPLSAIALWKPQYTIPNFHFCSGYEHFSCREYKALWDNAPAGILAGVPGEIMAHMPLEGSQRCFQ